MRPEDRTRKIRQLRRILDIHAGEELTPLRLRVLEASLASYPEALWFHRSGLEFTDVLRVAMGKPPRMERQELPDLVDELLRVDLSAVPTRENAIHARKVVKGLLGAKTTSAGPRSALHRRADTTKPVIVRRSPGLRTLLQVAALLVVAISALVILLPRQGEKVQVDTASVAEPDLIVAPVETGDDGSESGHPTVLRDSAALEARLSAAETQLLQAERELASLFLRWSGRPVAVRSDEELQALLALTSHQEFDIETVRRPAAALMLRDSGGRIELARAIEAAPTPDARRTVIQSLPTKGGYYLPIEISRVLVGLVDSGDDLSRVAAMMVLESFPDPDGTLGRLYSSILSRNPPYGIPDAILDSETILTCDELPPAVIKMAEGAKIVERSEKVVSNYRARAIRVLVLRGHERASELLLDFLDQETNQEILSVLLQAPKAVDVSDPEIRRRFLAAMRRMIEAEPETSREQMSRVVELVLLVVDGVRAFPEIEIILGRQPRLTSVVNPLAREALLRGELGASTLVSFLGAALRDTDSEHALFGACDLLSHLGDEGVRVLEEAARGNLGGSATLPAQSVLARAKNVIVQPLASGRGFVSETTELLRRRDRSALSVLEALLPLPDVLADSEEFLRALVELLEDSETDVPGLVVGALRGLESRESRLALLGVSLQEKWSQLRTHRDWRVRAQVALSRHRTGAGTEELEAVLRALEPSSHLLNIGFLSGLWIDPDSFSLDAEKIGELDDRLGRIRLMFQVNDGGDPAFIDAEAYTVSRSDLDATVGQTTTARDELTESLIDALGEGDATLREKALRGLAGLGPEELDQVAAAFPEDGEIAITIARIRETRPMYAMDSEQEEAFRVYRARSIRGMEEILDESVH